MGQLPYRFDVTYCLAKKVRQAIKIVAEFVKPLSRDLDNRSRT